VDVWCVDRLLRHADAARRRHDDLAVDRLLTRAIAAYRGPLLADVSEAWAMAPRERLRRRLVQPIDTMARAAEARRAFDSALVWHQRGLDVDDLAEGFYQGAMRAYRALGRPAEAAALLQRCRGIMQGALGVEPSAETLALGRTH
jgi:two-component SAPR family response regulator